MKKRSAFAVLSLLLSIVLSFSSCIVAAPYEFPTTPHTTTTTAGNNQQGGLLTGGQDGFEVPALSKPDFSLAHVPYYIGSPYTAINNNVPQFYENQCVTNSYEYYSPLDSFGRCGIAVACVGIDLMPTEPRGDIGSVTPSGWENEKYDSDLVDGGWLYNRCHLIGFQLSGENANEKNLITGTRYFNVDGMLPFENQIAAYVKETENHVLFRVTPIYNGNNLVASGVQMEGYSIEDAGEGICFNVFVYNVQPGIDINYADGSNALEGKLSPIVTEKPTEETTNQPSVDTTQEYVLNTNSKKFHDPDCRYASSIKPENKETYIGNRNDLISEGYEACKTCKP